MQSAALAWTIIKQPSDLSPGFQVNLALGSKIFNGLGYPLRNPKACPSTLGPYSSVITFWSYLVASPLQ